MSDFRKNWGPLGNSTLALVLAVTWLVALVGPGAADGAADSGLRSTAGGPSQAAAPTPTIISLTFDDGRMSNYRAARLLADHGVSATFYIPSGLVGGGPGTMTWTQIAEVAREGHDIGGHTRDHVDLTDPKTTYSYKLQEVCADRQQLERHGFRPSSFAYPYATFNATAEQIVEKCGYRSGRIGGGLEMGTGPYSETLPPRDPYAIRVMDTSSDGPITLRYLKGAVNGAVEHGGGWVPLIFHDVCFQDEGPAYTKCMAGYRPVSDTTMSAFLRWIAANSGRGLRVKDMAQVMGAASAPAPPRRLGSGHWGRLLPEPAAEACRIP